MKEGLVPICIYGLNARRRRIINRSIKPKFFSGCSRAARLAQRMLSHPYYQAGIVWNSYSNLGAAMHVCPWSMLVYMCWQHNLCPQQFFCTEFSRLSTSPSSIGGGFVKGKCVCMEERVRAALLFIKASLMKNIAINKSVFD